MNNLLNTEKENVFIFTHIPKTAGTSLRIHFQKHLKDQEEFIHFSKKGHKNAQEKNLLLFHNRDPKERLKAKVILGHDVDKNTKNLVETKTPIEIVIFREPISWEISRYNQYAHNKKINNLPYRTFSEWMNLEEIHSQFDWYLLNYCKYENISLSLDERVELLVKNLSQMSYIYFVDELEKCLQGLLSRIGVPSEVARQNVTGKGKKKELFIYTDSNVSFLNKTFKDEIEIYKIIKSKFDLF